MKVYGRSAEQLVEEQLVKWQAQNVRRTKAKEQRGLIITVSRETGCGGSEVAKRLSEKLGLDLIGGQIIQRVAESVQMSTKIIESLDEREVTTRDEWLDGMFGSQYIWSDQYFRHLTRVIGTIGRYGSAVVVGRGAHLILPRNDTFRVRFIAPLDFRIRHMMDEHGLTGEEAEKYVIQTDADRRAFIRKYFHVDSTDSHQYDLIVNLAGVTIDGAVETIHVAARSKRISH
jgi:cytidylate kinase